MTVEAAVAPYQIERDVGVGNLMGRNCGQNQETSAEPKHEPDKLGLHVEGEAASLTLNGPYLQNDNKKYSCDTQVN